MSTWSPLKCEIAVLASTGLCLLQTARIFTQKVPLEPPAHVQRGSGRPISNQGSGGDTSQFWVTFWLSQFEPFKLKGCLPGRGDASASAAMAQLYIHDRHLEAAAGSPGSSVAPRGMRWHAGRSLEHRRGVFEGRLLTPLYRTGTNSQCIIRRSLNADSDGI